MMTGGEDPKIERDWYSVSAASVRRWLILLLIPVLGVVGYRYWSGSQLQRQAQDVLNDASALAGEYEIRPDIEEVLRAARTAYDRGDYAVAVENGERFIALVNAIIVPGGRGVRVLRATGGVESRHGDGQLWQGVRSGAELQFGDWVKTDDGGSAELLFSGGSILNLRPGTLMRLDAKAAGLMAGDVEVATASQAQTVTTPGTETRLSRGSEAKISVGSDGGSKVAVFKGEAEVKTEQGETRRLGRLQQVVKVGGQLSEIEVVLARPQLLEPADRHNVDPAEVTEIVLAWQPVDGAGSYRLQISTGPLFATRLIDDDRSDTTATIGAREVGDFHWRVAALDGNANPGPWSQARAFRVGAAVVTSGGPPPMLKIDELGVFGLMVLVTGRTDPDAQVTVQGRELYVRPGGLFQTTVELKKPGKYTLRIVATNESGGEAIETREVVIEGL